MNISLVLFYSETCSPCKGFRPLFKELSKEHKLLLEEIKVEDKGAFNHAQEYGISAFPYALIIKDNIIVDQIVGFDVEESNQNNKKRMFEIINKYLKK
jgi:thiol-disulfide isomerase/thioredoxin